MVIWYVNCSQHHVWQNLPGYITCNWLDLCDELCNEYVSPTPEGQFSRQKLINFAAKYAQKCMGDETDVINYQRQFNAQSKVLLGTSRITISKRNTIFWCRFHPEDQRALYERLIAMHPNMPRGQAFDLKDVFNIMQAIFSGNNNFLLQELSPCTDRVRMECSTLREYSLPHIETRTIHFQNNTHKEDKEVLKSFIYQLHALPQHNPKYAFLYVQSAAHFPNHMTSIPRPGYQADTAATYLYQVLPPPLPMWSAPATAPIPTPVMPIINAATSTPFFQFGPHPKTCVFCRTDGHQLHACTITSKYICSRHATWINDRIHLPNGQPVPFDGSRCGIKASIDAWLTSQTAAAASTTSTPAQTQAVFMRDTPLHLKQHNASAKIKEIVEAHMLQVRDSVTSDKDQNKEDFSQDILEVFAAERKKRMDKASELSVPCPKTPVPAPVLVAQAPTTDPSHSRPNTQYQYQSNTEDQQLVSKLEDYLMQGKLSLTTLAHVFAASPAIHKDVVDKLKVQHVETNEYEVVPRADLQRPMLLAHCNAVYDNLSNDLLLANNCPPAFCLPLQELDVLVGNSLNIPAIYDTGSQIIVIRKDIVQSLGIHINTQQLIEMEGANGATNWTVGCAENLSLQVGDVLFKIHAHVVKNASFGILFSRPFQQALLCRFEDLPGGKVELSVCDPSDISCQVYIPTRPHIGCAPAVKIISVINHALLPTLPPPAQVTAQYPPPPLPLADALISPLETDSTTSAQCTHPHCDHLHTRFHTAKHISKARQGEYSCWLAFMHFTHLTDFAMTCGSPDNPPPFAPPVPEAPSAAIIDPTFRFAQDISSISGIAPSL